MSRVLLLRNCIELEGDRVKVNLPYDDRGYYLPLQPDEVLKKVGLEGDLILSSYGPDWSHCPLFDLVFFVTEKGFDLGLVESQVPATEIIDLDAPTVQQQFLVQLRKAGYYSKAKPRYRLFGKTFFEDLKGQGFEYPLLVDVKADGLRISLGKEDGKPFIWVDPEDLKRKSPDCTDRFPAIVRDLEKLPDDTILDGEFIAVKGNEALHRTVANALMNSKAAPEDLSPWAAIFVFDILKYDGRDLRDLPLSERLKYLGKLPKFDRIVVEQPSEKLDGKHPAYIVHSDEEMEKAIDLIHDSKTGIWDKAAEGVMVKKLDHPYEEPQNHGWCLKGGSYLLTPDGFIQIKYLKPGMEVLAGDGKFHKIKRVFQRAMTSEDEIIEINTHYSPKVRLTADHEVLTTVGWVAAGDLWGPLREPKLSIEVPEPPKEIDLQIWGYRKKIGLTPDLLKAIGFILAEGSFVTSTSGRRAYQGIRVGAKQDLGWFKEIIQQSLGVKCGEWTYPDKSVVEFYDPPFAQWLRDTFIANHSKSYGTKNIRWKTYQIKIPLWFARLTEEQWLGFVEGYWLGDGYRGRKYRIGTSSSYMAGTLYLVAKLRGWDATVNWAGTRGENAFKVYLSPTPIEKTKRPSIRKVEVSSVHRSLDLLWDLEIEGEQSYSNGEVIFHNSKMKWLHEADVVVLARKLVKGQTDVWNYELGINITEDYARRIPVQRLACMDNGEAYFGPEAVQRFGKPNVKWFMRFGKSDNTKLDLKVGDVLRVAPEEVLEEPNEENPDYPVYRGYISIALEPVPEKDRSDDLKVFERLAEEEPQRISIEELKRLRQQSLKESLDAKIK